MAQRGNRVKTLLIKNIGARRDWLFDAKRRLLCSLTERRYEFWVPGLDWMGAENIIPTWIRILEHSVHSESLY
jgi:hypothetical protein